MIYLLIGCEQLELQQHETNGIDSIQTENKDCIESWDNDALPSTIQTQNHRNFILKKKGEIQLVS